MTEIQLELEAGSKFRAVVEGVVVNSSHLADHIVIEYITAYGKRGYLATGSVVSVEPLDVAKDFTPDSLIRLTSGERKGQIFCRERTGRWCRLGLVSDQSERLWWSQICDLDATFDVLFDASEA